MKIFLEQLSLDQPLMTENSEVDEVVRKYRIHWLHLVFCLKSRIDGNGLWKELTEFGPTIWGRQIWQFQLISSLLTQVEFC